MKGKFLLTVLFILVSIITFANVEPTYAVELACDPNDTTCDDGTNDIPSYCNDPLYDDPNLDYSVCPVDDTPTDDGGTTDTPDNCDTLGCDEPSTANIEQYERIYKKDGYWYGVIHLYDSFVSKSSLVNLPYNELYIQFDRELTNLERLEYTYILNDYCSGFQAFGVCITGEIIKNEEVSTIAYDKETFDESIEQYTTLYDQISRVELDPVEINETFDTNFDESKNIFWIIRIDETRIIKEGDIIEYTYVLTDEEVDLVMADIQAQYDRELQAILLDPTTTLEEKELAKVALDIEYAEYTIAYGESITSLCTDDDACHFENPNADDYVPITLGEVKELIFSAIKRLFIIMIGIVVVAKTGWDFWEGFLGLVVDLAVSVGLMISNAIKFLVIDPIISFTSFVLSLIFWWL